MSIMNDKNATHYLIDAANQWLLLFFLWYHTIILLYDFYTAVDV